MSGSSDLGGALCLVRIVNARRGRRGLIHHPNSRKNFIQFARIHSLLRTIVGKTT